MEIEIATLIVGAAVTGGVSAAVTVAAIKVDLRWIKRAVEKLESRADGHDIRLIQLERN